MVKPYPILKGQKIGIVALAGPMDSSVVFQGEAYFKKLGYEVVIAPSCFEKNGYLAGADEDRAMDLMILFADDEIGAIVNMRGGYGSNRILPYIEGFNFSKYPKPFIGYSDITYIHIYLNQMHKLQTYHGPMIRDLLKQDPLTNNSFLKTGLLGQQAEIVNVKFLNDKRNIITGPLIGGNLSIICTTLGTREEIDTRNKILFLEEVGEEPYAVDRLLLHLLHAGKIQDSAGIILGDFSGENKPAIMKTVREILLPTGKLIATGIKAGHMVPNLTLPLGAICVMDPVRKTINLG